MVAESTDVDSEVIESLLGLTLNEETGAGVSTCLERVVVEKTVSSLHFSVVMTVAGARVERMFVCAFVHGKFYRDEFETSVKNLAKILLKQLKTDAARNN